MADMADHRDDPHMISVDDDETGEHHKTVYAHFGLALYFAQCLEHGLVNALVYLDLIPNHPRPVRTLNEWTSSFDGFMDKQFENTLGQLIARLRKIASVPDELRAKLIDAIKTRNWLAHDYFRERALEWVSQEGRDRMIAELEECQKKFLEADRLLDATGKPVREKYGFTDERLQQAYEEMLAKARGDQR
jgi:hypothetical protein